jgi:hypothetical protein
VEPRLHSAARIALGHVSIPLVEAIPCKIKIGDMSFVFAEKNYEDRMPHVWKKRKKVSLHVPSNGKKAAAL